MRLPPFAFLSAAFLLIGLLAGTADLASVDCLCRSRNLTRVFLKFSYL